MMMPRDPLRRDRLEERLHRRALAGDHTAFLRLRGLRRLWRAQDINRKSKTTAKENRHD